MHVRFRTLLLALVAAAVFVALGTATTSSGAGAAANYVVLYKAQAVPGDAAKTIANAGGTLVASYDEIGVAIARSSSDTFRADLLTDNNVENASATTNFATRLSDDGASADASQGDLPNAPATDTDTFTAEQWDMRQIRTPQAHAITGGSPAVLVGDIDTGLDYHHPDLAPNVDAANSVNCVSGTAVPGAAAADDDNGHGTHTAGTIAAASNGIGIVGVAPNVKIAGIKAGNADGYFFPEAVICAFMWAGSHHFDVTNNSYFADPFLFNCRNDAAQRAIWKAEQRAIMYAQQNGVTVVAAMGNESEDLAHPSRDITSPDDQPVPEERDVTNACVVIPVEIPGVIGVTATGSLRQTDNDDDPNDYLKSFYSSLGVGVTQVTAPGGDSVFRDASTTNGRVLSTYPAALMSTCNPARRRQESGVPLATYCYLQGTSMASPHAAGVAALIISVYGDSKSPQNGKMRPNQVKAYLTQTADPQPCPTAFPPAIAPLTFTYEDIGAGTQTGKFYACQGGPGNNSWYGNGRIDALNAVTKTSGNG